MPCLPVILKVIICGGILAGCLKSLIVSPLWQIVFPACWGLMSYSSKCEHPADLIPNPCTGIAKPQQPDWGLWDVLVTQLCWGGQAELHLQRSVFVGAQKGSRSACDVFSAVVEGWVICGWTGTNCSQLCLGEFLLWVIHQIITSVLMWSWTSFKSSLSLLSFRIFQVFPTWLSGKDTSICYCTQLKWAQKFKDEAEGIQINFPPFILASAVKPAVK